MFGPRRSRSQSRYPLVLVRLSVLVLLCTGLNQFTFAASACPENSPCFVIGNGPLLSQQRTQRMLDNAFQSNRRRLKTGRLVQLAIGLKTWLWLRRKAYRPVYG